MGVEMEEIDGRGIKKEQESRAVARKPRNAAVVLTR